MESVITLNASSTKFDKFHIHETSYKTVDTHKLAVHVLIPKSLNSNATNLPLLVRWHGGYLVTGAAMLADFVPDWALEYCIQNSAIWVSPDYRLLPESTGLEILSDVDSFWDWVENDLGSFLAQIGSAELVSSNAEERKVLVYGESAGGYLAVQSILRRPGVAKAVIAAYPMLELDAPFFGEKYGGKSPFGAPQIEGEALKAHLKHIYARDSNERLPVVSQDSPPTRLGLALVMIQQGLLTRSLGVDDSLFPLRVLNQLQLDEPPHVFVFHGSGDTVVPYAGMEKFVKVWADRFGDDTITSSLLDGEEHGFDITATLVTDWLKAGLDKTTKVWLS